MIKQPVNIKSRLVRLPENKLALRTCLQRSILQVEQALERSPSAEEIAQEVHLGEKTLRNLPLLPPAIKVPLNH